MNLDVGALIDSVATVVALVGVAASFWLARRGQRQDLALAKEGATGPNELSVPARRAQNDPRLRPA